MWDYTNKVMDHFLNPRNVGEIENPDAVAEVGNITCGDALKLYLKLDDSGRISDVKFKTFGCASAIASSSALTELVKGMTLDEAAKVTNKDIVKLLGSLPEEKMHCSVMGMEALQAAIADYKAKHGEAYQKIEDDPEDHEGRIVCKCFGVTDTKIRRVAKENNLHTAEQVTKYTKAGGACGACLDQIQEILDGLWKEHKAAAPHASEKVDDFNALSVVQKVIKVQSVIDREIRPQLEHDGGDIELVDIQGNQAIVRLKGHCAACMAAKVTLKNLVEAKLHEFVSDSIQVVEAK
ncbi:MAG TPA: Fe-S cluster assembly protein NifU [Lentisphaeria bacterium]|nr:Fe-S cluster assembly protein NifU [Lentisphaeria bacterium]